MGAFFTIGHTTKTENQSSSTKYIETNTGSMPSSEDKEIRPKGKDRTKSQEKN